MLDSRRHALEPSDRHMSIGRNAASVQELFTTTVELEGMQRRRARLITLVTLEVVCAVFTTASASEASREECS